MARQLRVEYSGAIYHVLNRGDRRWREAALATRAKGDAQKAKLAVRLRQETMMTAAWIAERLQMGSVANLHRRLSQWRKAETR